MLYEIRRTFHKLRAKHGAIPGGKYLQSGGIIILGKFKNPAVYCHVSVAAYFSPKWLKLIQQQESFPHKPSTAAIMSVLNQTSLQCNEA